MHPYPQKAFCFFFSSSIKSYQPQIGLKVKSHIQLHLKVWNKSNSSYVYFLFFQPQAQHWPHWLTFWAWEPERAACWAPAVNPSMCQVSAWGTSVCSEPLRWSYRLSSDRSAHRCTRAKASGKREARCSPPTPPGGLSKATVKENEASVSSLLPLQNNSDSLFFQHGRGLLKWTSQKSFNRKWTWQWCDLIITDNVWHPPTIYGSFMQGVSVDLVIIISYEHSSVCMPVVPQHSCDGGGEAGELKAGGRSLDWTQTHTLLDLSSSKKNCFPTISRTLCL